MIVRRCVSSKSKVLRRDAVQHRGARHVDALVAAEERSLRRRRELACRGQRGFEGRMARCADRAADIVLKRPPRLALDRIAPSLRRMGGDEIREDPCGRRCVRVRFDARVACHGSLASVSR
jgi:hypothetical protein